MTKLTQYSRGSGCGCKIAPADLALLLKTNMQLPIDKNLLVGNDTNDDAAVYTIDEQNAIVSTTDFFMPMVDDAYTFGQIAACNAISDVYAMGAKPIMALGILGWPVEKISVTEAQQVLDGARSVCQQAGISLCGGHSIDSAEPFFGLAVNGLAAIKNIKQNNKAQEGDLLFLTKPIGLGILSAACKRKLISEYDYEKMVEVMTTLNDIGLRLSEIEEVNAITDVTGFGLLGHLTEMAKGSGLSAEINYKAIPLIENIEIYTQQFCFPDITTKNFNAYKDTTGGLNGLEFITLCDPQTSGGLLVSVSKKALPKYLEIISFSKYFNIAHNAIGSMIKQGDKCVYVAC